MALTPFLDKLGTDIAGVLEKGNALPGGLVISQSGKKVGSVSNSNERGGQGGGAEAVAQTGGQKQEREENFVLVCGYGRVGKMVCDMLGKLIVCLACLRCVVLSCVVLCCVVLC